MFKIGDMIEMVSGSYYYHTKAGAYGVVRKVLDDLGLEVAFVTSSCANMNTLNYAGDEYVITVCKLWCKLKTPAEPLPPYSNIIKKINQLDKAFADKQSTPSRKYTPCA
jgi:hypothetical protein